MATGRAVRGPGRAGPENPGPRALRAETGLMIFLFKSPLCIMRWPLGSNMGITVCNVVTCKCVVYYWTNVHETV